MVSRDIRLDEILLQSKYSQQHTDVLMTTHALIGILAFWLSFFRFELFADDYQVSDIDPLSFLELAPFAETRFPELAVFFLDFSTRISHFKF